MARRRLPPGTKQKAIRMMVEGMSDRAIAEELEVRPQTVHDWHKQDDLRATVMEMRAAALEGVVAQLQSAAGDMYTVTRSIAMDPEASVRDRLTACEMIWKRSGVDALSAMKIAAMQAKDAPDASAQAAFNALVESEVERRLQTERAPVVPSEEPAR